MRRAVNQNDRNYVSLHNEVYNHTEYHRSVLMIKVQNDASRFCIIMIEGKIHTG